MYKVIVITYQATKEQLARAAKWVGLATEGGKYYNLPSFKVQDVITEDSIVIAFGQVASNNVKRLLNEKPIANIKLYELPHLSELIRKEQNTKWRAEAIQQLKTVKTELDSNLFRPTGLTIKEQHLPNLNHRQLLLLQKITEEAGQESCFQVTKGGKLIEISNEPLADSKATVHLTFRELYTIRIAMDVLGVHEVTLVSNRKNDTS